MDALVEGLMEELNCETVFTIPLFGGIPVYESVVVTWIIMAVVFLLCILLSRNLSVESGYEHCVANMYYVPAGMIAKLNPLYVKDAMEQYGYTAQQLSTLNIPNFIFNNLIPVTIGNIVGGMAFFGIPLMYINGVGGKKA